jgi:hypothetical protein|nr:MAG TPA: hypothetical protein [Caudoviricetes sp.]
MERFLIDDGIKQSKIVANRYKWSIENADMGSEDANELHADICNQYVKEYEQIAEWLEELKSYKDAEEQGLLVRLPCKVGDTVYVPTRNFVSELRITMVSVNMHEAYFSWMLNSGIYPNLDGFSKSKLGKSVFLTREEAEKKLEEMKNEI